MKFLSRNKMSLKREMTNDISNESSEIVAVKSKKKLKLNKKTIIILVCIGAVILLILGLRSCGSTNIGASFGATYMSSTVEKKDISVDLTGSGTLKPADSYDVTSLVAGAILNADFKEGDIVDEGTVLYQIDTKDAETSIKSATLNLQKCQLSYNTLQKSLSNLSVVAPSAGTITELSVKVGDNIAIGQKIGTIRNSSTMSLSVPFNSADVDSFYVGQAATITLDSTFETLSGNVSKISNAEQVLSGNMLVKYVTIDVTNPGGITDTTVGTAKIGEVACNSSASFKYKSSESITAKTSGTIASVSADEGNNVQKGAVLIKLSSSELEDNVISSKLSLEEAQNGLDNKKETLKDYTITSPIAGTIITKKYKAGDKLDSTSGKTALCTIYDLSYLTMDMSVDELDVSKVKVGQEVAITADAVEGKTFTGIVTKVNISGTTTNGVTAYPVTIKITDTDGLLPGMNVSAKIVLEAVENVITVPVDAVTRGNMVLVCKDSSKMSVTESGTLATDKAGIPVGFEYAEVKLGVNNAKFIEITGGLNEGDTVAVIYVSTDTNTMNGDMPAQGGDQGAGGPPNGGGGETTTTTGG